MGVTVKQQQQLDYHRKLLANPKVQAMLRTIRHAEGTSGESGYGTRVGGEKFSDYSKKPGKKTYIKSIGDYSTAEGAYQFLNSTWDGVSKKLGLPDFSPESQDIAAVNLIIMRGALGDVLNSDFTTAVNKLSPEWASLPKSGGGSTYKNQKSRGLSELSDVFYGGDVSYKNSVAPYINQKEEVIIPQISNFDVTPEITNFTTPTETEEEEPTDSKQVVDSNLQILQQKQNEKDFLEELYNNTVKQETPEQQEQQYVVPKTNFIETYNQVSDFVDNPIMQQGGNISQFLKRPVVPRDEKNIIQRDNTNVKKQQLRPIQQLNVRNKTDKEIAQEREAKIQASMLAQKTPYTQENWREQLAAETAAIGDKLRFSNEPNAIDDSMFNPVQMIAGMATNLGQAPLQAKQTDSNLPYLTSIGAPLAVGAIGGLGTKTTGQFVDNLVNPLAGSERVIKYNKLYNLLPNELNPNLLNAKNGENWIKEWYSNPETKIKASAYEELNPGQSFMDLSGEDKINLAISDLSLYKDKNYIDILKDKGLNKYIKHTLNSQGVSYGVPDEIYTKSQALYGLNKVGREGTKVHELTHLAENNGNILNTKESDALLEPFGYSTKEVYNSNKTPLEVLGSRDKTYYLTPTEIHARMNEARYNLGLKPQDLFTENDYETIKNGVDWFGMGKYIKDKDKFIKLMNNFYTVAPIAGASYLATQEQPKFQQGGTITDNEKAFLEELKISIGNKPLNVKVLNTDAEKEQGLIGVTKLAKNEGVLLPNSNSDDMRKMSIDTQLVWLDDDYKVIGTQQAKKGKQYKNSNATHFIELHPSINVKVGQKIDLNKERAIEIKPSKIQGEGAFIKENINIGTVIGLAHRNNQPSTELGQYHNHSEKPNSENVKIGDNRYLVSLRPMKKGEEITVNYRNQPELEQPEDFKKK